MFCCDQKDLKVKIEDDFECIEAKDCGNNEWHLRGCDTLDADSFVLKFDENKIKKIHVTKWSNDDLENYFSDKISVYKSGRTSEIVNSIKNDLHEKEKE